MNGERPIVNGHQYRIRRIFLEHEAREIIQLQSNASEFHEHYPMHSQWLEKAVKEIINGNRIAFGVFRTVFDIEGRSQVQLAGTIILKFEVYTNIAMMKNLFIEKGSRGQKNGTYLCEMVENYCAKQGYSKIETEVPGNEYGTIKFLLERGYKIYAIKNSPYKPNEQLYEIYKDLTPLYGEDFFDIFDISEWLLNVIYDFKNIKSNKENSTLTFELNLLVGSVTGKEDIIPKGLAVIIDKSHIKYDEIHEKITKELSKYNLILVFGRSFERDTATRCRDNGILIFDKNDIQQKFKDLFAYVIPEFEKEEIGGIIVPVNPEYFDQIKLKNSFFAYLKAGSIGKYLNKDDIIIFYSEPSQKYPKDGIKGYGKIVEVHHGKTFEIWDTLEGKNPIFTYDEYISYAKNKKSMIGLVIDNFRSFEPLNFQDLNQVFENYSNYDDLCNNYISKKTLNRFDQIANRESKLESKKEDMKDSYSYFVAFSFADENREIVEQIVRILNQNKVKVFYDNNIKTELWGKNLPKEFQEVYGRHAQFFVPFISKDYVTKDWPKFELSIALEEAKKRTYEFILPIRIDDAKIVGIPYDLAYLDYNKEGIKGVVNAILDKLHGSLQH